jgi:tRNA (cmo5U34)-methyltransferase
MFHSHRKVLGEDSLFNRLFIDYYYDFKRRNHYNDMEIAQKREGSRKCSDPL